MGARKKGRRKAATPVDARGRLADDPFEAQVTKAGAVLVRRGGRQVAVVGGAAAVRLAAVLARGDEQETQLALARATGHYKH